MKNAAISVIMPSLNVVQYIEKALTSALEQTLEDLEIICVDAGSTDGTLEILEKYRDKDSRIRLLMSDHKSYGTQVNLGIKAATGKYIAILETDDYIDPKMYEALYTAAEGNDCDFVKCNFHRYWTQKDGTPYMNTRYNLWDRSLYNKVIVSPDPKDVCINDLYLWDGIYKKSFLEENGIEFSETDGAAFQDIGFLFQTGVCGKRIMYLPEPYYFYCVDRESSSSNSDRGLLYSFHEYNFVYARYREAIRQDKAVEKAFYCMVALTLYWTETDYLKSYGISAKPFYDWLLNEVRWAADNGIITDDDTNFDLPIRSLLIPFEEYRKRRREREDYLLSVLGEVGDNRIVVFGCGNLGIYAYRWTVRQGYTVDGFIDNDAAKWDDSIDGVAISDPNKIDGDDEGVRYVVANMMYSDEMKQQLLKLGVKEQHICLF